MTMKYNTTYTQKLNLKNTIFAIAKYKSMLIDKIKSKYSFIELTPPVVLEEDSELLISMSNSTRQCSFDTGTEYKVATFSLSHTNWLRLMIEKLDIDFKEGVMSFGSFVWRDLEESPTSTIVKEEITFQIKMENSDDLQEKVKKIAQNVYRIIFELAEDVKKTYEIDNPFPENAKYVSSQMLENEFPNEFVKQREIEFALENEAFILMASGEKMYSGKIHSNIPPYLYDLKNFYQIVLRERNNNDILKVGSVGILASGDLISDQLNIYGFNQMLTYDFYDKMSKIDNYKVVEIKINTPRLMMALLAKGHIAEVQAGVLSSEAKVVKEKYGIETI